MVNTEQNDRKTRENPYLLIEMGNCTAWVLIVAHNRTATTTTVWHWSPCTIACSEWELQEICCTFPSHYGVFSASLPWSCLLRSLPIRRKLEVHKQKSKKELQENKHFIVIVVWTVLRNGSQGEDILWQFGATRERETCKPHSCCTSSYPCSNPSTAYVPLSTLLWANTMLEQAEILAFSIKALESQAKHQKLLQQLEQTKRARQIAVPTNDGEVQARLRELREPIILFGEKVLHVSLEVTNCSSARR